MPPPIRSRARALASLRQTNLVWLHVCAALALVLIAVVPHVTLAASAGHMAQPMQTGSAHHGAPRHDDARADLPKPGHDCDDCGPKAASAMPSCCIMGCGLISLTDEPDLAVLRAGWRIMARSPARTGKARVLEPAERPPRLQHASSDDDPAFPHDRAPIA